MRRRADGFTLIELIVVILIGSILTGVALSSFSNVQTRFAVQGAKQAYMTLHQRARSKAVESGETVILVNWASGDSVALLVRDGADSVWSDQTHFRRQFDVDVRTPGDVTYVICMTPRGYADYNCGSWGAINAASQATFADTFRVQFWLSADSASVLVLPMGQLVG
jgi:prepilin-type N-terminal cleavage/methylation domain-containing protein